LDNKSILQDNDLVVLSDSDDEEVSEKCVVQLDTVKTTTYAIQKQLQTLRKTVSDDIKRQLKLTHHEYLNIRARLESSCTKHAWSLIREASSGSNTLVSADELHAIFKKILIEAHLPLHEVESDKTKKKTVYVDLEPFLCRLLTMQRHRKLYERCCQTGDIDIVLEGYFLLPTVINFILR
jgi:hypothetical protein